MDLGGEQVGVEDDASRKKAVKAMQDLFEFIRRDFVKGDCLYVTLTLPGSLVFL